MSYPNIMIVFNVEQFKTKTFKFPSVGNYDFQLFPIINTC